MSLFGGIGGVVQSKFFNTGEVNKGFLGLAPRVDMRFIVGYSDPSYFVWFTSEFDLKSNSFSEMQFNHTYHLLKVVAGIRIQPKKQIIKKDSYRLGFSKKNSTH